MQAIVPLQHSRQILLIGALCYLLCACTVVGPAAISSGRMAYNEAISETDNQQMLAVLVHNRYGERGHLLTVASVTANVSVTSSAGVQAGFGNTNNYRGNLVPFTGGLVYEENPTISYIPVSGERYLRELTSPIPIAMLAQLTRTVTDPGPALTTLVVEVNGIYNPDFIFTDDDEDPRFDEFTRIVAELTRAHRLNWVQLGRDEDKFALAIDQSQPEHAAETKRLLALMGLPAENYTAPRVIVPVSLALTGADSGGIGITTRSVWDLVEVLAAVIEVPENDVRNGVVTPAPPPGRIGKQLRVSYSESKPEHAFIAVEFREGWFYINERDLMTKQYFKLLGNLWTLTMAKAVGQKAAAPVLTVPVSR